jgi:carboxymethylenebutenolidase
MKRLTHLLETSLLLLLLLYSIVGCAQSGNLSASTVSSSSLPALTLTLSQTQTPKVVPGTMTTPALVTSTSQVIVSSPTQTMVSTPTISTPTIVSSPKAPQTPPKIIWSKPATPINLTIDSSAGRANYTVSGTQVSGYFYKPQGTGPFPAVLVLHGRAGLQDAQRLYASWLASQGNVAFAPDYFAPIGMSAASWAGTDYAKYTDQIRELLGRGLEALKSLSYVDSNNLEVVGFSLGGYYAFILATREDVKSIVSYYGAYVGTPLDQTPCTYTPAEIINQLKAPVLMFHGDKDELVPIAKADTMNNLIKGAGKSCDYVVYSGAGHAFGEPYVAMSKEKVLAFFKVKQ